MLHVAMDFTQNKVIVMDSPLWLINCKYKVLHASSSNLKGHIPHKKRELEDLSRMQQKFTL